jgi:uncharacterized protein (DUF169 family)
MTPKACETYRTLLAHFGVEGLQLPTSFVKIFREGDDLPHTISDHAPSGITLTACQAERQAVLGDAVCLTRENIGCVAAAISFGLVGQEEETPLEGPRVYTTIMKDQALKGNEFAPPSPADFQRGTVYACHSEERPEFALFGPDDSGRFKDIATARKAIAGMACIEPADTQAVLFYSPDLGEAVPVEPDVIVLGVRPVELTRLVQAWQFMTGERIEASMGGLRVVNSDLIVRPYLTGRINVSSYCLGARLIAKYGPDRMGMGIPVSQFETLAEGMKRSFTGFPFPDYPGARQC